MNQPRFTTGGGGGNYFREGYEEKCGTCCTGLRFEELCLNAMVKNTSILKMMVSVNHQMFML